MSVRWLVSSWQLHDALIWHLMTVWDESCKCHELTRHLNLTNPMRHAHVTNSKRHLITWHLMSLWVREFHSSEFVTSTWRIELTSHWWNPLKWVRDIYMTHWVDISLKSNDFASWWNLDDSWVRDRHMTCWDHTSECQKVWCILDIFFFGYDTSECVGCHKVLQMTREFVTDTCLFEITPQSVRKSDVF